MIGRVSVSQLMITTPAGATGARVCAIEYPTLKRKGNWRTSRMVLSRAFPSSETMHTVRGHAQTRAETLSCRDKIT